PEAVAAAVVGAGVALLGAALALAHRHVSRSNILSNAVRARILEAMRADPGATIQELARVAGVSHTTATYHLGLLEEVDLAVAETVGNRKHWFTNGAVANRALRLRILLGRMGRAREVLSAVESGPARLADVAGALGMSLPGALWHLKRLVDLGLVDRDGDRYRAGTSQR
ncbi:MAG TPA: helix-turn-helix domain-containing protein, partial [Candidatus Thermoplasmatota archaeon]|nr:helix-turn-helix domain-containing protein [Candidatus Thermoplasmatota archaeon]